MFGTETISVDDIRHELEAKAAERISRSVNMPTELFARVKKLSLETGVSVNKILVFLIDHGMEKIQDKTAKK
jgi:predicted DNA-binding protein